AAVDRYWPVPRNKWSFKPGETEELMTLPNSKQIVDFAEETNRILSAVPVNEERNAKFKARLEQHRNVIKNVILLRGELYKLVGPLDNLLNDIGDPEKPAERPNLQEFWQAGPQADLREQLTRLIETIRYGDPYLVSRTLGKGRVLAYLSTANAD